MKLRILGIVVCLAALLCVAGPGWGQDAEKPAEQPAAMQTEAQTAEQPAAMQSEEQKAEQPAAMQSEAQPAAATEMTSAVKIEDAVVCQDVVDRAPVGASDTFAKETARVYCFSRVVGADPDSQITHNWYYKGALKASVKLNVRSSNFRTWSSKALLPEWSGEWMVEILSDDGKPLESIIFVVQ